MPTSTKTASAAASSAALKSSASSTASTASTVSSAAPSTPRTTSFDAASAGVEVGDGSEEGNLRAYSKELYTYTLDLLNSVRIEGAQRRSGSGAAATTADGKYLKRTVSDVGVVPVPVLGSTAAATQAAATGKAQAQTAKAK